MVAVEQAWGSTGTPRGLTAVMEGTMEATATPASVLPSSWSSAVTSSKALRGPDRQARLAS